MRLRNLINHYCTKMSADIANGGLVKTNFGFTQQIQRLLVTTQLRLMELLLPTQENLGQLQVATAIFAAIKSLVTFTSPFSQDLSTGVVALDTSMSTGDVAIFQETRTTSLTTSFGVVLATHLYKLVLHRSTTSLMQLSASVKRTLR